jgi:hypothetical protein
MDNDLAALLIRALHQLDTTAHQDQLDISAAIRGAIRLLAVGSGNTLAQQIIYIREMLDNIEKNHG